MFFTVMVVQQHSTRGNTLNNADKTLLVAGLDTGVEQCHGASVRAGWYTDLKTGEPKQINIGERLMLIVSEVAEAMEGDRKNKMDDKLPHRKMIEVELADTVIRIFDLAGYLCLDLSGAVVEKLEYNANRADHQIANRQKDDGKKY